MLQLEGELAAVRTQHDRLLDESEDKLQDATDAVDNLEHEKCQLLSQLEERQRCCADCTVIMSQCNVMLNSETTIQQGSHASWEVLDFFFKIPGPGKS